MRAVIAIAGLAALIGMAATGSQDGFPPVLEGRPVALPTDAGAHADYRIEWWYVTGHLDSSRGPLGFQVTFFRLRNQVAEANPSFFSPRQLLFAHAALAHPSRAKLLHDERSARAIAGLAEAKEGSMDVRIDDWSLRQDGSVYRARIAADDFDLDLVLTPTQPAMLEGDRGYSRKGPSPRHASYYYSEPQLRVTGTVRVQGNGMDVHGTAWLDHEWSSELLAPEAIGWDWAGLNLDDGTALMAFRIRADNGAPLWAGATLRKAGAAARAFGPGEVRFSSVREWKSPRTGAVYPIATEIAVGGERWRLEPLMDDQELDARASTGTVYWEGAVRASGASSGRGYLELTGYAGRLRY